MHLPVLTFFPRLFAQHGYCTVTIHYTTFFYKNNSNALLIDHQVYLVTATKRSPVYTTEINNSKSHAISCSKTDGQNFLVNQQCQDLKKQNCSVKNSSCFSAAGLTKICPKRYQILVEPVRWIHHHYANNPIT